MFGEGQKQHSLLISMDSKGYLQPGTDVGVRDTKAGVVYDVCEPEKQKQLPQHDFNQAPASFQFIQQHTEKIEEKGELISNQDQSVVIIWPKYYIRSCSSVLASDYMRLSHDLPMLFQEGLKWKQQLLHWVLKTFNIFPCCFLLHWPYNERCHLCYSPNWLSALLLWKWETCMP